MAVVDGAASAAVAAAEEVAAGTLAARTGTCDVAAAAASGEAAAASASAGAVSPNPDPAAPAVAMNLGEAAAAGALTGAADPKSDPAVPAVLAGAAAADGQAAGLALGLASGSGSCRPRPDDGSIPAGVLVLPPPLSTAAAINQLDKDVQVCTTGFTLSWVKQPRDAVFQPGAATRTAKHAPNSPASYKRLILFLLFLKTHVAALHERCDPHAGQRICRVVTHSPACEVFWASGDSHRVLNNPFILSVPSALLARPKHAH